MKLCNTRYIKKAKAGKEEIAAQGKLFSGTLHFVSMSFPNNLEVSSADLATSIRYTQLSAPLISDYCSAYGSNSLQVNSRTIPYSPSTVNYDDAKLQQWADSIAELNSIPNSDCLIFLNPQGAINSDADATKGVIGYHSITSSYGIPYSFVNVLGSNFTPDDRSDIFAAALSHEVAEMCVDPRADLSAPECCDPCAGNCQTDDRNFFDAKSNWIRSSESSPFPPNFPYAFFIEGIVLPAYAKDCPAPARSCQYAPP